MPILPQARAAQTLSTSYSYGALGKPMRIVQGTSNTALRRDRGPESWRSAARVYGVNSDVDPRARGSETFAYNQANEFTSATVNGATSAYTYDGDDKRDSPPAAGPRSGGCTT